jgi:ABC-2 type transport system ATP-binding protein
MGERLRVEGISKAYRSRRALHGLSFTVDAGEIVGLVGPNGAGKSTTLRIVTGLLAPDTGTVSLDGLDLATHPRAYRARLGALIESPAMLPMLTARQHLEYVARLRGRADRQPLDRTLRDVGLDPASSKRVGQFSLGMKQRLGLAMALFARPSLLVLDEPMNGLDPAGIAELREFLRTLPDRSGGSVLVSSHLLAEIELTCHRVLFLRDGRLIADTALSTRGGAALRSLRIRTADDARAEQVLRGEPFIVDLAAVRGGLTCRVAEGDVAAIAPVLVTHGIGLLELGPDSGELEEVYLARYASSEKLLE